MEHVFSSPSVSVSFNAYGHGPPLVLVHGSFSDHETNWTFVSPLLETSFSIYAVARRGRGETTDSSGHTVDDEARDVVSVIQSISEPVLLLGHSYGAQVALAAAATVPERVRKLVLYEPPLPDILTEDVSRRLEELAQQENWGAFAMTFFGRVLEVPASDLEELRGDPVLWKPIAADARASVGDIRAMGRYRFDAGRFRQLPLPVLLQIGSESPRDFFATDALAAALPDVSVEELPGQAHDGMTTAPEMYARAVTRFLLAD